MFLTGGIIYFYFEIFARGYSHISMFVLGGLCFLLVGEIGTSILKSRCSLFIKVLMIMIVGTTIITLLELITGLVVNVLMGLNVWSYENMKYNYLGQICVIYSLLWSLLGLPCVYLYGLIDCYVIGEQIEK